MKPTITGQKRPLEQDSNTESGASKRHCPSREAREVAAILASLDDPRSRDLSPATQEALRVINTSLQRGYPLLDLRHVPAAELVNLPMGLIHPLIHTVQALLLPSGLKRLPSFCQQLSRLERLDLPEFAGDKLDLRDMVALHQLHGSATQAFRCLFVNALADVRFQAPGAESKIRVYRYEDDRLIQQHALPSHPYFKVLPGNTTPDFTQLNGVSVFAGTQKKIYCNTIAPEILYRRLSPLADQWKKTGYFGITDAASLSATITEDKCQLYAKALLSSDYYALVSDGKFGQWLSVQFERLLAKEPTPSFDASTDELVRGMRVFSTNHEIHFLLKIKPGSAPIFIAEMYDPNLTRTHRKMVANRLDQIVDPKKPWRLSDFIAKDLMETYMRGNESAVLCFSDVKQRKAEQSATAELWLSESDWCHPDIMFTLLDMQLAGHIRPYWEALFSQYKQNKISLSAVFNVLDAHAHNNLYSIGLTATNHMIRFNHSLITNEFTPCIAAFAEVYFLASSAEKYGLPDNPLRELLTPMSSWSHFIAKMASENKASLNTYFSLAISLLDKGYLPDSDALALLSAKNLDNHGAIAAALQANDPASLRLLGTLLRTLVARGTLSANHALELIGDSSPSITSGPAQSAAWKACALGSKELIHELASLLIRLCKKDSVADSLSSSLATDNNASVLSTFLMDELDMFVAEDDLSEAMASHSNDRLQKDVSADDDLRRSLHTVIFGGVDPECVPSMVSSETHRIQFLENMRQLVQLLIDHELLSYLDEAGKFMIATDDLFASADSAAASHSAEMLDIFQQSSGSRTSPDFS